MCQRLGWHWGFRGLGFLGSEERCFRAHDGFLSSVLFGLRKVLARLVSGLGLQVVDDYGALKRLWEFSTRKDFDYATPSALGSDAFAGGLEGFRRMMPVLENRSLPDAPPIASRLLGLL